MAWKHIYREYRVQHRETFRVWERLASFCFVILFSPHFSLFEVRHTKHTKGRLAQPKTSEKSSTLLLVEYDTSDTNSCQTVNGIQNSMKENLWRLKRYGNCLRVSMARTTCNLCSQIVELLLHLQNGKKNFGQRVKLESVPGTTMDHVINATYIAAFLANLLANKYNGTKMWFQGRNGTRKTFAVQFLFLYLMLLNSSFLVWNVHLTLIVVVFTDGDDVEARSVLLHHTWSTSVKPDRNLLSWHSELQWILFPSQWKRSALLHAYNQVSSHQRLELENRSIFPVMKRAASKSTVSAFYLTNEMWTRIFTKVQSLHVQLKRLY